MLTCSRHGVTLSPEKFKFGRREVDFCGFHVEWEGFHPSDEMIAAIRDFPMPPERTITDIRAWFGVVNQLAPFLAKNDIMPPFHELLKTKNMRGKKVYWDDTLQNAFHESKKALCEIASQGLTY